jgi:hypothetical protein
MSCLKYLIFLLLLLWVTSLSLFASNVIPLNSQKSDDNIEREIGISITPVFSMDTVDPQVTVISPNGAELWTLGTQKNILWFAFDSNFIQNPMSIFLSIDNGQNYSSIANSISNDGYFIWTIPNLYGPQSLIKISAMDSFGNMGYDMSDVVFTLPGTTVSITPVFTMDTLNPSVDLLSPNGGETWFVGESNYITWNASDSNFPSSPVTLQYKTEDTWFTLEESIGNESIYEWIIPNTLTTNAYVRIIVTDTFGNTATDSSQSSFIIDDSTPAMVQNVNVIALDNVHVKITWDPVTTTVQGNQIVPTGYIVLANSSDELWNMNSYYVLGITDASTEFIHENAISLESRTFYRIVAFKNFRGQIADIKNLNYGNAPVSWDEIKQKLAE